VSNEFFSQSLSKTAPASMLTGSARLPPGLREICGVPPIRRLKECPGQAQVWVQVYCGIGFPARTSCHLESARDYRLESARVYLAAGHAWTIPAEICRRAISSGWQEARHSTTKSLMNLALGHRRLHGVVPKLLYGGAATVATHGLAHRFQIGVQRLLGIGSLLVRRHFVHGNSFCILLGLLSKATRSTEGYDGRCAAYVPALIDMRVIWTFTPFYTQAGRTPNRVLH
jgi:hypothetical protein